MRLTAPTTVRLYEYMRDSPRAGRNNITMLCLGKDGFGVDVDRIADWWMLHSRSCTTITLVLAHAEATNPGNALTPNYIAAPFSSRRFALFDMRKLMRNLIGLRRDNEYLDLLEEWRLKFAGREQLSHPHHLFRALDDRGRNNRTISSCFLYSVLLIHDVSNRATNPPS